MKKVYYAGCFLSLPQRKYAFQERDENILISNPGAISTFGGRIESGENALAAIRRELREEIGLDVNIPDLKFIGYIERYDEAKDHVVGCSYFFHSIKVAPVRCHEGKIVILDGSAVIENERVGRITKEMYLRIRILEALQLV